MSKLSQLQGKGQVFNIGGVDLELKPLRVDELELLAIDDKAPMEEQLKASKKLIYKVLKNAVPNATEEEINNISLEHLSELMGAIQKLHKLPENAQGKIKDVNQSRKNQQPQGKTPE